MRARLTTARFATVGGKKGSALPYDLIVKPELGSGMKLRDFRRWLDLCFAPAPLTGRIYLPDEPRLDFMPGTVWWEQRWYGSVGCVAEVFFKWRRVPLDHCAEEPVIQAHVHIFGASSPSMRACVDAFMSKSAAMMRSHGELYYLEGTLVELENIPLPPEGHRLEEIDFRRHLLALDSSSQDERAAAVKGLLRERSLRVVQALLAHTSSELGYQIAEGLSGWGVQELMPALERLSADLESRKDLLLRGALVFRRRLQAWASVSAQT